jgi:hypothetical protein
MNVDFSIDQPFGIKLYPYFEYAYQIVTGRPAASFVFTPGVTPLSTNKEGKESHHSYILPNQLLNLPYSLFCMCCLPCLHLRYSASYESYQKAHITKVRLYVT